MQQQVSKGEPDAGSAVEAQRGAGERVDERRRRLAEIRASLSVEALAMLKYRAEEVLALEGVERMRLGYEVLVKLKVDELLEREDLSPEVSAFQGDADTTAVES